MEAIRQGESSEDLSKQAILNMAGFAAMFEAQSWIAQKRELTKKDVDWSWGILLCEG